MGARHSAGGAFENDSVAAQNIAGDQCVLVGDDAINNIEHHFRHIVSNSVSICYGLHMWIYRQCQHLHVRVRCT